MTVFSFGAGQDSTYLLHRFATDSEFRAKHVKGRLLVVGSDTGDEHPYTYSNIEWVKQFSEENDIDFHWITPDMGFHPRTWQSLTFQYKRNSSIGSAAFQQTCTDNLKVKVVDNFVEQWLKDYLNEPRMMRKSIFHAYKTIRLILGFAAGEEARTKDADKHDAVWKKEWIRRYYPLIVDGIDRQQCIDYNTIHVPHSVWPSNCMRCFYQSDQEVLWLFRFHPDKFKEWVEMEEQKYIKHVGKGEKNLGVYGKISLTQKLARAQRLYWNWTDEQLNEYKFSHGHCIKSKY